MKLDVSRVEVWSAKLQDKPGMLASKLEALTQAGVNMDFLLCRRTKAHAGTVYVAPIHGPKQCAAAKKADFVRDDEVSVIRVVGPDKPGMSAAISHQLALAGVNIAGVSTTSSTGKKFIAYLAFDGTGDAALAKKALSKMTD